MTYCNEKQMPCEWAQIGGGCSVSACRKVLFTHGGRTPTREPGFVKPSMTNADHIRSMTDEELAERLFRIYRQEFGDGNWDISRLWCDGGAGCVDEYGEIECDEERNRACILRYLKRQVVD